MRRLRGELAAAFIALAALAFGPALNAPFDFDDIPAITENASIRQVWPPATPLRAPAGTAVSGRPVVNYTFALNYALNRWIGVAQSPEADAPRETISYHIANVILHVVAALLLFAIVRRSIRFGRVPEDWRAAAERIAAFVAGIWLLHPIQTEAVDYVSQRTELLASVCYLATLYAAIRAWHESQSAGRELRPRPRQVLAWSVTSVIICLLGMGSKEVMITAPIMVMLYDRAFLATGWRTLWSMPARRRLYGALIATSVCSLVFVASGGRGNTVGFDLGITWYEYLYSQAWAIPHYLGLVLWPDALTFDYGRNPIHSVTAIPGFIGLAAAGVGALVAWRYARWQWLGFLGAWFFLLLAPSSSIIPIRTEIAAERRIYLALAAVIVLLVIAAEAMRRRIAGESANRAARITASRRAELWILVAVGIAYMAACGWTADRVAPDSVLARWSVRVGIGLAAMLIVWCVVVQRRRWLRFMAITAIGSVMLAATFERSAMYRDLRVRWRDGIAKTPTNGRAYNSLASAELRAHPPQIGAADSVLRIAMAVDSMFIPAWVRSASIALAQNRLDDAASLLNHALLLHPGDAAATEKLGKVLLAQKRPDLALPYIKQYAAFNPNGESLTTLGLAYLMTRQVDSAITALAGAVRLDSTQVDAPRYLGAALIERDRSAEAVPYLEQAVRLDPASGIALALLSLGYAQAGEAEAAMEMARRAVAKAPDNPTVYVFAGRALQTTGRFADAATYLEQAVRLDPNEPQALTRLGMAQAAMGHSAAAARLYQRVLAIAPGYPLAQKALEQLGRRPPAR